MKSEEITVADWVRDYIYSLFTDRGYAADDEKVVEVISNQWMNWKRLMVKAGLNADQQLAQDVAFEFSTKPVPGGAGRIFEHFGSFVLGRPAISNQVREQEVSQYAPKRSNCQNCDGQGVVMIPVSRTVQGEEKRTMRAYKCNCEATLPYAGLIPATPEMLDWAKRRQGEENQRLYEWSMQFGLDESKPEEFRRQWCEMFRKPEPQRPTKDQIREFEAKSMFKPVPPRPIQKPVQEPVLVPAGVVDEQDWSWE